MSVKEKLVELLADVGLCHYNTIADHLIAHGVTVQEWISVEDRLPDRKQGTVLMVKSYRGKAYVDIGEIFCDGTYSCCSDAYAMNRKEHILTHWMPLPEPPAADMRGGKDD